MSVNVCVASGATPFVAVTVIPGKLPVPPEVAVPDKRPAAESPRPGGKVPVKLKVGAGLPVAVTVNVPVMPTAKVAVLALVIVGD